VAAIERTLPRIETIVMTAINRRNLPELPALRDYLAGLGVRRWQIQLVGRLRSQNPSSLRRRIWKP
jgi:hypothetical protein